MKRIEFIAPVEAMRGNLSGKQTLVYNDHDNAAFDAPNGRQYAKNYRPSFIGAKRTADGKKYFSVKTKSATVVDLASKQRMARLGAIGAIFGYIQKMVSSTETSEQSTLAKGIYNGFLKRKQDGELPASSTFRDYCFARLSNMISFKQAYIVFPTESGELIAVANPWVKGEIPAGSTLEPVISEATLIKFWDLLANNPLTFTVDDVKCVAHMLDSWATYCDASYNTINAELDDTHVKVGDQWVQIFDPLAPAPVWSYVAADETIRGAAGGYMYRLTSVEPE